MRVAIIMIDKPTLIHNKNNVIVLAIMSITALLCLGMLIYDRVHIKNLAFDGGLAYQYVQYQIELGPRVIGNDAHDNAVNWIREELTNHGWEVSIQDGTRLGIDVHNIIAKRGEGVEWFILGAHYDSRSMADEDADPSMRTEPVPGANDGASGVAVLLELSRIIPEKLDKQVWLVFFDAEDDGNIHGKDWILGSQEFVARLEDKPTSVIIIDMIGDSDLNIYLERNSDPTLSMEIWEVASRLGYSDIFIPEYKYRILDDHIPFLRTGIPAVDIIDFDYPYWHTTEDTIDKVSPESLSIVGNTLMYWLESKK